MKTKIFSTYHPEWIENFAQMRKECDQNKAKKVSLNTNVKVKDMQKQKGQRILGLVKRMKHECGNVHQLEQKRVKAVNDVQMVENFVKVDVGIKPVTVSADYVRQIHSYARHWSDFQIFKYHCVHCQYKSNKKSNYDDHAAENCVQKPNKYMKCPICASSFTYRTLRQHLGHYSKGKHIASNEHHAKYSPKDHQILLNSLKELKKTKQV